MSSPSTPNVYRSEEHCSYLPVQIREEFIRCYDRQEIDHR
jgi:hypothetical protein